MSCVSGVWVGWGCLTFNFLQEFKASLPWYGSNNQVQCFWISPYASPPISAAHSPHLALGLMDPGLPWLASVPSRTSQTRSVLGAVPRFVAGAPRVLSYSPVMLLKK